MLGKGSKSASKDYGYGGNGYGNGYWEDKEDGGNFFSPGGGNDETEGDSAADADGNDYNDVDFHGAAESDVGKDTLVPVGTSAPGDVLDEAMNGEAAEGDMVVDADGDDGATDGNATTTPTITDGRLDDDEGEEDTPTVAPTWFPTEEPTDAPTWMPTEEPTDDPTFAPTWFPTEEPTTDILDDDAILNATDIEDADGDVDAIDDIVTEAPTTNSTNSSDWEEFVGGNEMQNSVTAGM